ncbi:MAG: deoxyribose-phosphate aldolase [Chitinophagales bacterium]
MEGLNKYIEHTLLKPDTKIEEIEMLCADAIKYNFAGVCIPTYFLSDVASILNDTGIELITVIGFPYGYNSLISKFDEAEDAIAKGADHLDVVINIAAIKNNDWDTVENEIETLVKLVRSENKIIKVIAETGLMSEVETDLICKIANEFRIDYLKTSTGINGPGADVETITSLRELLESPIKIKASGGIRTKAFAIELIEAGADRIGTSKGVELVLEP